MSEEPYSNQTIRQYLLGSLPETETEALDGLSITDDEFAHALRIAENDLVDAYVQGELSGSTLEQFKSQYLASPLRREKVQFAQAFQAFGLKAVVAQAASVGREGQTETRTQKKSGGWFSTLSVLAAPRPALQWGTAFVALILLIAAGWLVFENARLHNQMSQTQARSDELSRREQELRKEVEGQRTATAQTEQELARVRAERERLEQVLQQRGQQRPSGTAAIASFILVPQLRGAGQAKTVTIPAGTEQVAMRLQLEPNQYSTYSVTLLDQSSHKTLWNSGKLKAKGPADSKSLNVSFRAALLKPQTYVLQVSGISASGTPDILGDYPFRVVK